MTRILLKYFLTICLSLVSLNASALWDTFQYTRDYPAVGRSQVTGNASNTIFDCELENYHFIAGYCTSTLIGTKTALGAHHCGDAPTTFTMCNDTTPSSHVVDESLTLPNFLNEKLSTNNDIRIMKLDTPELVIPPVPFNTNSSLLEIGKDIIMVGLGNGATESEHGCRPPECERASSRKREGINALKSVNANQLQLFGTNEQIFEDNGYASVGSGDSGGPLFMLDNGLLIILGPAYGSQYYPRTDTRSDWIMSTSDYNARPSPPILPRFEGVQLRAKNYDLCQMVESIGSDVTLKMDFCAIEYDAQFSFDLVVNNHGLFKIVNRFDNKCLTTNEVESEQTQLQTEDCSSQSYRWNIYERGTRPGQYIFIERPSDKCIDGSDQEIVSQSVDCSESDSLDYIIEYLTLPEPIEEEEEILPSGSTTSGSTTSGSTESDSTESGSLDLIFLFSLLIFLSSFNHKRSKLLIFKSLDLHSFQS